MLAKIKHIKQNIYNKRLQLININSFLFDNFSNSFQLTLLETVMGSLIIVKWQIFISINMIGSIMKKITSQNRKLARS